MGVTVRHEGASLPTHGSTEKIQHDAAIIQRAGSPHPMTAGSLFLSPAPKNRHQHGLRGKAEGGVVLPEFERSRRHSRPWRTTILPRLLRPPCVVKFSSVGGDLRRWVPCAPVPVAIVRGQGGCCLPLPIRRPHLPRPREETDKTHWQERVVRRLGLRRPGEDRADGGARPASGSFTQPAPAASSIAPVAVQRSFPLSPCWRSRAGGSLLTSIVSNELFGAAQHDQGNGGHRRARTPGALRRPTSAQALRALTGPSGAVRYWLSVPSMALP